MANSIKPGSCINTCNPQLTGLTLALLSAGVGMHPCFHDGFIRLSASVVSAHEVSFDRLNSFFVRVFLFCARLRAYGFLY